MLMQGGDGNAELACQDRALSGLLQSLTKQLLSGIRGKDLNRGSWPFLTTEEVKILQLPRRHMGIPFSREGVSTSIERSVLLSANTHLHPTGTKGSSSWQYWGAQIV